jgi:MarR family transcriptional regulator, lower aerobic nicotinate degradation pathway regulator
MAQRARREAEGADQERPDQAPYQAPSPEEIARLYAASGYDLPSHPAHIIRRAHQRATMRYQELMGRHGLTPTQLAALATVLRYGEVSQNQLGRLTAMDPSTISIVVHKLLKLGLVVGVASVSDQRLSLIRMTPKGARLTLPLLQESMEVGRRVLSPLNEEEQKTFLALLRRVADGDETPLAAD